MNAGAIITIIIVVAWVVKGIASVMGNEEEAKKKGPARSLEEWDELQAKRREAASAQRQGLEAMRADSAQNPAQMTMAERIELARQRARQQAGLQTQSDDQAEALRRARAQAERQAQQKRAQAQQAAERERAARQEQASRQRERVKQQRRRQAEQEAQRNQRRSKQRRSQSRPATATTGSKREAAVNQSQQRGNKRLSQAGFAAGTQAATTKPFGTATSLRKLDRAALRQAFIMKELLDKPVALRDPQADLLS